MENIFGNISKTEYKNYIGIQKDNPSYYKILFISDGSGIVTKGQLYATSPYFIKVVDTAPEVQENDTLYFVKNK